MKKELKALLSSKEGTLRLNELFELRRTRRTPEEDVMGRELDFLRLEMRARVYRYGILIESRDTAGIMREAEKGMAVLMNDYRDDLMRYLRGGKLR